MLPCGLAGEPASGIGENHEDICISLGKKDKPHHDSCALEKTSGLDTIDLQPMEPVEETLLPNGDIYVGTSQGGRPDGTGKYLWSDGCMYEGEWSKGKTHGRGKFSWPSGSTYEGEFMACCIHGLGTFAGSDGTFYKGSWYLNEKKGLGIKCYANGDVYEGSWNQGIPDGVGRYIWKNGNEYVGDWKSGVMSGRGILMWTCGDKYDGQWLDGLEHGHGVYTWADGSTYAGAWSRGLKNGKGIFCPPGLSRPAVPLLDIQEQVESDEDALFASASQRAGSSSSSDTDQLNVRVCRMSSHGSSIDGFTCVDSLVAPDDGLENCASSEHRWSLDDSFLGRIFGLKEEKKTSKVQDGIIGRYHLVDSGTFILSVVEREYVQGVLINELILQSQLSRARAEIPKSCQTKQPARPGETIFKGHQSYNPMLSLQLGIRYSVGKITSELKKEVCSADFGPRARIWMNFPTEGSQFTPPHESVDFKWKDYCPAVFRRLRELFKIDTADYMLSICGDNRLRELSSPGKSGSVFYLSHDDRYMIKTMRKAEVKVLLGMLLHYYDHVQEHENTLITKFFGLHRIKPAGGQKVRFVVMGNMFCTELQIHRRFDLKGSSQGRSADKFQMDENTTLKDLDLDFVFRLEPTWQQALLRQIECDCKFLELERIMDYSLLLGLHFRAPQFPAVFSPHPTLMLDTLQKDGVAFQGERKSESSLFLVAHEPDKKLVSTGSHVRGSPLRASGAGNEEVDLLLPGTARLRIQLGVNMPARADHRPRQGKGILYPRKEFNGEAYDVVLYLGIIDILQEYNLGKKLEHAYKSLHYDSASISAVDPSLYSERFQNFIREVFPDNWD